MSFCFGLVIVTGIGERAREIFKQSGISHQDLFRIWNQIDPTNSGRLNANQFTLGMHLINQALGGALPIPSQSVVGSMGPTAQESIYISPRNSISGPSLFTQTTSAVKSKWYTEKHLLDIVDK